MSVKGVSLVYLDAGEESELIEAAQTGNRESYLRLVRQYQRPMFRAAFSMTRDSARAETLTHDVFVRAWQRIHDFPRGQRFFPWLLRAARGLFPTPQITGQASAAADGVVDTASLEGDELGTGASTTVTTGTEGTSADAGWAGAGVPSVSSEAAALAAFSELRPDEQMALSMRLLEKISYEEIAAILDLTLGVVTLRMSQARGHLLPRAEALTQESE